MTSHCANQSFAISTINAYLRPRLGEVYRLFFHGFPSDAVSSLRSIKRFVNELRIFYPESYFDVLDYLASIEMYLTHVIDLAELTTENIFRSACVFVFCQCLGGTPSYYVDVKPGLDSLFQLIEQGGHQ